MLANLEASRPFARQSQINIGEQVGKYGVSKGERGVYDTRNSLNDLTGKEWLRFTKSWFVHNPPRRTKSEKLHPAKFPESIIIDFVGYFTKEGEVVLDPMAGSGSTLVACMKAGRKGVGVELIPKWAKIAKERTIQLKTSKQPNQLVIEGDANNLKDLLKKNGINKIDFCITSPPYWNMLTKSRGHVRSEAQKRREEGLDVCYSNDHRDIGNIGSYENYLNTICDVLSQVYDVLKDKRYMVVIAQNVLTSEGRMIPLAWDLAKKMSGLLVLKQERIWLQDNKSLGCWGYPWEYVSNVHHHYCLVFKKDTRIKEKIDEVKRESK